MVLHHFDLSSPAVRNANQGGEREQSAGNSNAPFLYNKGHKINRNIKFFSKKKKKKKKKKKNKKKKKIIKKKKKKKQQLGKEFICAKRHVRNYTY